MLVRAPVDLLTMLLRGVLSSKISNRMDYLETDDLEELITHALPIDFNHKRENREVKAISKYHKSKKQLQTFK
jgi:hypothetical protein